MQASGNIMDEKNSQSLFSSMNLYDAVFNYMLTMALHGNVLAGGP